MTAWLGRIALLCCASLVLACREEDDDYEPIVFGDKSEKTSEPEPERDPEPTRPPEPQRPPPSQKVDSDPINDMSVSFLRKRAEQVVNALKTALPSQQRRQMENVPLLIDDRPGEVNAFAACTRGRALLAISDGLMEIQSQMARAKAHDEVFNTRKLDAYVALVARPQRGIARPGSDFYDRAQDLDARKVTRQHQLFDEELAFVLGHELAHHYLSHTGCIGSDAGGFTAADLGRVLSNEIPAFNQPNELASDLYGTQNALNAGKVQSGHQWTEQGALLTLRFFLALRQSRGGNIVFSFESTHPDPTLRIPTVEESAKNWRATGGVSLPILAIPILR